MGKNVVNVVFGWPLYLDSSGIIGQLYDGHRSPFQAFEAVTPGYTLKCNAEITEWQLIPFSTYYEINITAKKKDTRNQSNQKAFNQNFCPFLG